MKDDFLKIAHKSYDISHLLEVKIRGFFEVYSLVFSRMVSVTKLYAQNLGLTGSS